MNGRERWSPLLHTLLAMSFVVAACGDSDGVAGGDVGDGGTDASVVSSVEPATDTAAVEPAVDTEPLPSNPEPLPGDSGAPPDPWVLIAPAAPLDLPVVEPAADSRAQIEAMFSDVAAFIATDRRSADGGMLDVMEERRAKDDTPDLVLAIFASLTSNGADSYGIIQAHAAMGLTAGFDPESARYFEVRQRAATALRDANVGAYDIAARARNLSFRSRSCIASALLGDTTSCDDDPAAEALIDELAVVSDLELPDELDDFDDQLSLAADLCSLWVDVKAELGPEQLERVDRILDGSLIDNRFLGRSECRRGEGLERDAEWDVAAGGAMFAPLYEAVVAAGAAGGYDEAVYQLDDYQAGVVVQRATMNEIAGAAAPIARSTWTTVDEPNARFGLLTIAYLGALEAWFQSTVSAGGFDAAKEPTTALSELVPCGAFLDPRADLSSCSPEERAIGEALRTIDLGKYYNRLVAPKDIIDWEDVAPRLDLCDVWLDAFGQASSDDQSKIDFQLSQLGLDDLVGVGECDTGIVGSGDSSE